MKFILRMLIIYVAGLSMSLAQTAGIADQADDPTVSERARLGNQRIQAEAEARAREEQRRLEEEQARLRAAEQAALRAQQAAARTEVATAQNSKPAAAEIAGKNDMSRTLEQLRTLGELKDDGYITEEEFQRIKQKILDSRF